MQTVIIGVTFFLGVGFGLVAVVALFTKTTQGKGSLRIPGVEISGAGAPILFLFVSAVLVLAGFGWASSRSEAAERTLQKEEAEKGKEEAVKTLSQVTDEKKQITLEAAKLYESLDNQLKVNRELTARVPPIVLDRFRREQPLLMNPQIHMISPHLRAEIAKVQTPS